MRPNRATVLFAVLFGAALATAVVVVGARTPELVLEVRRLPDGITPNGDMMRDQAEITFFVRESEPHAQVTIVGRDLVHIKTLDDDVALEADKPVRYIWDATTDEGEPAPIGRYRLRVVLPSRDRDMVFPKRIDLTRPPPNTDDEATEDAG